MSGTTGRGSGAAGPAIHPVGGPVLVFNAGSSTLKASIVGVTPEGRPAPAPLAALTIEWGSDASREAAVTAGVDSALAGLRDQGAQPADCVAVAHRVVHGGDGFRAPAIVDEAAILAIEALAPLAPLHNPVAAATIRAARERLPTLPHVAVFDTAFHATLPEAAWRYPLPADWESWGIRRYGFHGLSVAWAVERAAALLGRPAGDLSLVVAHLGSGCSVTAVERGRSAWTSMGMTPLEGLMMGTRAGSVDPGILLAVLRDGRRTLGALAEDLDHRSGLLGVSGSAAGMRELEISAGGGDERAALAIAMFVDRAAAGIAAAATALPRLDALVFTGGIGEHARDVCAAIIGRLRVLAVPQMPDDRRENPGADTVLADTGRPGVPVVLRVLAREDVVAARAALRLARPGHPLGGQA